ncbi:MAG: hypothetical protein RBS96_08300, partial [Dehalococcoidales bacterium]|nr:hypothetical protein [Dehalococcoidales bacterium]
MRVEWGDCVILPIVLAVLLAYILRVHEHRRESLSLTSVSPGIAGDFPDSLIEGFQMFVHLFIYFAVEPIIDLVIFLIWFENLAHMRHRP